MDVRLLLAIVPLSRQNPPARSVSCRFTRKLQQLMQTCFDSKTGAPIYPILEVPELLKGLNSRMVLKSYRFLLWLILRCIPQLKPFGSFGTCPSSDFGTGTCKKGLCTLSAGQLAKGLNGLQNGVSCIDLIPAPPNNPLRYPTYHLKETIRPLIELHWVV